MLGTPGGLRPPMLGEGWMRAQSESGAVQKEGTKILYILAGTGDGEARLLDEISEEYKRRFEQESVLVTSDATCVAFK